MSTEKTPTLGEIPMTGRFTVKFWATQVFDCTEACVCQWIERHKIPYKELPGRNRVIDAVDMWERAPWTNGGESL